MKHITLSINGQDITGFKKRQCVYRLLIAVISRLWVSTTCSCLSNGVYIYIYIFIYIVQVAIYPTNLNK